MRPGRPRRPTEPDDAADALVRSAVHRLLGKRSPADGSEHLRLAVAASRLAAAADRVTHEHVTAAREAEGATWEQVGEAFGTTRQSAHERFRSLP